MSQSKREPFWWHFPYQLNLHWQIVKNTHVNLVDFVEQRAPDQPVRVFPSERALANYTKKHKKIFPRANVNAGSLLRDLLRRIFRPPP